MGPGVPTPGEQQSSAGGSAPAAPLGAGHRGALPPLAGARGQDAGPAAGPEASQTSTDAQAVLSFEVPSGDKLPPPALLENTGTPSYLSTSSVGSLADSQADGGTALGSALFSQQVVSEWVVRLENPAASGRLDEAVAPKPPDSPPPPLAVEGEQAADIARRGMSAVAGCGDEATSPLCLSPPSPPEEPMDFDRLAPGQRVRVVGLTQSAEFNGRSGNVRKLPADPGMYLVQVDRDPGSGSPPVLVTVRRENLEVSVVVDWTTPCGDGLPEQADDDPERAKVADVEDELASQTARVRLYSRTARALTGYTKVVIKCPWLFLLLYLAGLVVLISVAWRPVALDSEFDAFVEADGDAQRMREAYLLALREQKTLNDGRRLQEAEQLAPGGHVPKRLAVDAEAMHGWTSAGGAGHGRRLQPVPLYIRRQLTIMYEARDGNALDERLLRDMRDLELRLRSLPGWHHFCHEQAAVTSETFLCDPGETLAAFVWPTQSNATMEHQRFEVSFDGRGSELLAVPAVLAYLQSKFDQGDETRNPHRFFPRGYTVPPIGGAAGDVAAAPPPPAIRTTYTFVIRFGLVGWPSARVDAAMNDMKREYTDFIENDVYPVLAEAVQNSEHRIYFAGDGITDHEVTQALYLDLRWMVGSILFVTLYMWLHIQRVVVTFGCFCVVFVSIPVAYVITPTASTTIVSFLSIFLITVIDIDVVFVFVDYWEQSSHLKDLQARLPWFLAHAGKSCLATSLTTSISFFANLASCLQPLREFGLFMGLCVMSVFVLSVLFMPPLLVILERHAERVRLRIVDISVQDPGARSASPGRRGCCRRRPARSSTGLLCKTHIQKGLVALVGWSSFCAGPVVLVAFLCGVGTIYGIITSISLDTGVPEIFSEDHNQVAGQELLSTFATVPFLGDPDVHKQPLGQGATCNPAEPAAGDPACILHWCEAQQEPVADGNSSGSCWRGPTTRVGTGQYVGWDPALCRVVKVKARIAGNSSRINQWAPKWATGVDAMVNAAMYRPVWDELQRRSGQQLREIPALAIENWETGTVEMSHFFEAGVVLASNSTSLVVGSSVAADCEIRTICFFGTRSCRLPGWRRSWQETDLRRLEVAQPPRPPAPPRLLQGVNVPRNRQVDVTVVFGLRAPRWTPLVGSPTEHWSFDPTFDPANPWAQRAMYEMCTLMHDDFFLSETYCWVGEFRTWLHTLDRRFPTRDFDDELVRWYSAYPDIGEQDLWMVGGRMAACKMVFYVNVHRNAPSQAILDYKRTWDEYVDARNRAASTTANHAWHTAQAWVRAEVEAAIISSTAETIIIECACGWLCILAFTFDPVLALLVIGLVLGNISGLAFFMVCVMGWEVGPIEIISLIIFVGYSITFGLHIAHNYSWIRLDDPTLLKSEELTMRLRPGRRRWAAAFRACRRWPVTCCRLACCGRCCRRCSTEVGDFEETKTPEPPDDESFRLAPLTAWERREARARLAVQHVGGAIVSAAVSTIGSSMFLLFCTLTIFTKLGAVVISVTILSALCTLVVLPAVLVLFGPAQRPCHKRLLDHLAAAFRCSKRRISGHYERGDHQQAGQDEPFIIGEVCGVLE